MCVKFLQFCSQSHERGHGHRHKEAKARQVAAEHVCCRAPGWRGERKGEACLSVGVRAAVVKEQGRRLMWEVPAQ